VIRKGEVTVVQAAKRAQVTLAAVYQMAHRGSVVSRKQGKRRYIDAASLEAHLAGGGRLSPRFEASARAMRDAVTRDWHEAQAHAARACRGVL
jgi:hypothetical protein